MGWASAAVEGVFLGRESVPGVPHPCPEGGWQGVLTLFRPPWPEGGATMSHAERGPGERWTQRTGCALANSDTGGGSLDRRGPARQPEGLCPSRVAAGHRPGPSRHAGARRRPTRHTMVAGPGDIGGASAPRIASPYARSPVRSRPIFVGPQQRQRVRVAHRRRPEAGGQSRGRPRGAPGSAGSRDGAEPAGRWRYRKRRSPAQSCGAGQPGPGRGERGERSRRHQW
jgi:hypothetical protein